MAKGDQSIALRHLDTLFSVGTLGGLTDAQLLERFTSRRDQAAELAFAALIERHGPMVLRTCRAVLRDAHDAFQATFLVLARQAESIRKCTSLAAWLHGVACRAARRIRDRARPSSRRVTSAAGSSSAGV